MTGEQRIKKALAAKNWSIMSYHHEPVQYCPEGREGGYEINIDIEEYPETQGQEGEDVIDLYFAKFQECDGVLVDRNKKSGGANVCECDLGCIMAYNLKDVMFIINILPDRLSLTQ